MEYIDNFVVIENGKIASYDLKEKENWTVGRDVDTDVKMNSPWISRVCGALNQINGLWVYVNRNSKTNVVYYNGRIMNPNVRRNNAIILSDGDVLIFGMGDQLDLDNFVAWTMYSNKKFDNGWTVENTKDVSSISVTDGSLTRKVRAVEKGVVVSGEEGIAIYMGEYTYLTGKMRIVDKTTA